MTRIPATRTPARPFPRPTCPNDTVPRQGIAQQYPVQKILAPGQRAAHSFSLRMVT